MSLKRARIDVAALISGRGSNMAALLAASQKRGAGFRLAAVISNRADAAGLEVAARADIPTRVLDHRRYPSREDFDTALHETVAAFEPQLVVLAGFMRILTPAFVDPFIGRLLNIHPSLLPKYPGLNTHERALAAGDAAHGASVHFVIPALDAGPVIAQARVPVERGDSAETLAARVLVEEHRLYPTVVEWYAAGRVELQNRRVFFDGNELSEPVVLAGEGAR